MFNIEPKQKLSGNSLVCNFSCAKMLVVRLKTSLIQSSGTDIRKIGKYFVPNSF